jgi:hypothetical protein
MPEPEPLMNYTTAQQLGALRRELIEEGFTEDQAADMTETAFRCEIGFVVRFDGIAGVPVDGPRTDAREGGNA